MSSTWVAECEISERHLLQCVVEVAKGAFRSEAASVFVVDDATGDLVFEAVAGRGEEHLVGTRLRPGTGIAGWVAACGQPLLADDLGETQFSRAAAEETGYVPRTIAAVPLFSDGECVGVLEVLDRTVDRDELATLELLGLLASQAAAGVELLRRVRSVIRGGSQGTSGAAATAIDRIATQLQHLGPDGTRLVDQLLALVDGGSRQAADLSVPGEPDDRPEPQEATTFR